MLVRLVSRLLVVIWASTFASMGVQAQSSMPACPDGQVANYSNCFGSFIFSNGDSYQGEFLNGMLHGRGTIAFANGVIYEGDFAAGKIQGQGAMRYGNGVSYIGSFRDSLRDGQGTMTFADASRYDGSFLKDAMHGQGALYFQSGHVYIGEFVNGKREGAGRMTYPDGQRYEGSFKNDKMDGRGILFAANGSVTHDGLFADDKALAGQVELVPEQPVIVEKPKTEVKVAGTKVALVIGNGAYANAPVLPNPVNDAASVTNMLQALGFTVINGTDLGKQEMESKVREFVDRSQTADVSLFFYAGHGIQVAGQNYVVPIDAKVKSPTAMDFELLNVGTITNHMGGENRVGIVLLDACRDNPFTQSLARSLGATRSNQVSAGLAPVSSVGGGLLVGFATAPGAVAADGEGSNSPFTMALLKHFPTPNLEIQQIMTRVKRDVISETKNQQRPWHNSDLAEEVYLSAN